MEKTFTEEERLRRAIEISKRRNGYYSGNIPTARVNVNEKRDYRLFKRMILQIIICLLIYVIFYLINTTNYVFSKDVIKSTNNILNYDINFNKLYKNCHNFFITNFENNKNEEKMVSNEIVSNTVNEISKESKENIIINNTIENKKEIIEEKEKGKDSKEEEKNSKKTVMKNDADKVKEITKFKKPLNGIVTSEFGEREATIKGMTTDHKGIDIAAKSGTNIKSAISGIVSVAEENSEYGKFIKIVNGDIMTVYAHCKKLKVKVGDKIKLGQTIATVGSTGNSTGPHLHFEIRLENRYINPRFVIEF